MTELTDFELMQMEQRAQDAKTAKRSPSERGARAIAEFAEHGPDYVLALAWEFRRLRELAKAE